MFPIYGSDEKKYRLYPSLKKAATDGKKFFIKNPLEFRDFTDLELCIKDITKCLLF